IMKIPFSDWHGHLHPTSFASREAYLARKMCLPLLIWGLLVFTLTGAVDIQVPEDPVVAVFGQDATLHCSFSPGANFSLRDLSLIWQLTDTKRLVHSFADGEDQLANQGSGYANRTALFYDQLPRGNVSLLLRRVQISDEGSFTCFIRVQDYGSAAVTLQVAGQHLVFPAVALWVTVGLAICLAVLLVALAYVCQKKIRQSCKEEKERAGIEEQEEGDGSKTALQPLKSMEIKEEIGEEID
ncbi:hypothetical protein lerEdw1_008362, partial [Lerista edwardsae]